MLSKYAGSWTICSGRLLIVLLVCLLWSSANAIAQVSNITVKVQWDPRPAGEAVTQYTLVVDSGAPLVVLPAACTATVCEQVVTVAFASHTFSLAATNQWGTGPSSTTTSNLSIPGAVVNMRVTR